MPNVGKSMDNQVKGPAQPPAASTSTPSDPLPTGGSIRGDMNSEEPLGWDQAPQDIQHPRHKRHSRPDGVGGLEPAPEPDEKKTQK